MRINPQGGSAPGPGWHLAWSTDNSGGPSAEENAEESVAVLDWNLKGPMNQCLLVPVKLKAVVPLLEPGWLGSAWRRAGLAAVWVPVKLKAVVPLLEPGWLGRAERWAGPAAAWVPVKLKAVVSLLEPDWLGRAEREGGIWWDPMSQQARKQHEQRLYDKQLSCCLSSKEMEIRAQ